MTVGKKGSLGGEERPSPSLLSQDEEANEESVLKGHDQTVNEHI